MSDAQRVQLPCPHCQKWLRVPASAAGKRARCPSCEKIVTVPLPTAIPVTPAKPARQARRPRWPWVAGGAAVLVLAAVLGIRMTMGGPRQTQQTAPEQVAQAARQTAPAAPPKEEQKQEGTPEKQPETRPVPVPTEAREPKEGAGTVRIWNPHRPAPGNLPLTIRVLVLSYDPLVPGEGNRRLSEVFRWNDPAQLATRYRRAMEYASGGYLRFEIVQWRNLNEIYAQEGGHRYTVEEYVRNRRTGKGWRPNGMADYPRLLHEQNVVPLVDEGLVDEVWVFSDHFFGVWEASMAGPGAFFINGGVYPQVPSKRPFAFYGFNYERGVAEMMHDAAHRTEATMNRAYGPWKLKNPTNSWEKFSANHDQSGGLAGVGTCHWPANAKGDYDYGNKREVASWADAFLSYPKLDLTRKPVSRDTWSKGPDYHLDYMKWYFAHIPRASGVNPDGRENNWLKYIFDFQSYDQKGKPLPASAELYSQDVADPSKAEHTLRVAYRGAEHIDAGSLDDGDLTVTGPDGKALGVKLIRDDIPRTGRSYLVAHYQVKTPGGAWKEASGEYTVTLQADQVRTASGSALPGGRLGSFRVAGKGGPGALAADEDTTLLAHFDGSTASKPGKPASVTEGPRYEPGVVDRGVAVGKGTELGYPTAGILDPKAGSIEFWVQPKWNGNAGQSHIFFQAGKPFDNGLLIQIDGASNVRLMVWGDNPATPAVEKNAESGVGFSGAGWKAGDWHHLAATWDQSGRKLALYVDGQLAGSTDKGTVLGPWSEASFWVGSGPRSLHPAEAVVDELRISTRARGSTEVKATVSAAGGTERLIVEAPGEPVPVGGWAVARAAGQSRSGRKQDVTRQVAWSSSEPTVATVGNDGTLRAIGAGKTTLTARLGEMSATAEITISDPGLPRARLLEAKDITEVGTGPALVVVAYEHPDGIREQSLGLGDVRISGPNGFHEFPRLQERKKAPDGRRVIATYLVSPPEGKWRGEDRGVYTIEMKGFQVAESKGKYVPEGVLGQLRVLPAEKPR